MRLSNPASSIWESEQRHASLSISFLICQVDPMVVRVCPPGWLLVGWLTVVCPVVFGEIASALQYCGLLVTDIQVTQRAFSYFLSPEVPAVA